MQERVIVDTTLLTPEQRAEWDLYQQGFGSAFWARVTARLEPIAEVVQKEYDHAQDLAHLGRIQGTRKTLLYILSLKDVIENEFLFATGQLGGGADTEAPAEAGDWRA